MITCLQCVDFFVSKSLTAMLKSSVSVATSTLLQGAVFFASICSLQKRDPVYLRHHKHNELKIDIAIVTCEQGLIQIPIPFV